MVQCTKYKVLYVCMYVCMYVHTYVHKYVNVAVSQNYPGRAPPAHHSPESKKIFFPNVHERENQISSHAGIPALDKV